MKPPPFKYHSPETLAEVVALLAEHGSDARCLAGGQSLIPLMNLRMAKPDVLIDLNRCRELMQIEDRGNSLSLGAMVRQRDAELSEVARSRCPLLSKALSHAGPVAVRSRATVGGSLAHADRAAELPGVAVALDAVFVLASAAGQREVPAGDFFFGDMATAIESDEMLKEVTFPVAPPGCHTEFLEVGTRREGVAMLGLAAQIAFDGEGLVNSARLAVIGVEPAPVRLKRVEELIAGRSLEGDLIGEAAKIAADTVDPLDDPYVKASYRRRVTGSLIRKALRNALPNGGK